MSILGMRRREEDVGLDITASSSLKLAVIAQHHYRFKPQTDNDISLLVQATSQQ
jgi:hypothetical protein